MYQYMRERMNMKKEYVAPVIVGEEFSANEYVAACWGVGCSVERRESGMAQHLASVLQQKCGEMACARLACQHHQSSHGARW